MSTYNQVSKLKIHRPAKQKHAQQAFTIVEVMIVLALGGIIVMTALLAISQLQRIQRDNARKNIATNIKVEIESYASNSQGVYPLYDGVLGEAGAWTDFYRRYVQNRVAVADPSLGTDMVQDIAAYNHGRPTDTYNLPGGNGWNAELPGNVHTGEFWLFRGARCNGTRVEITDINQYLSEAQRKFAIVVGLESDGTYYCIDNG